jgi:hypothetical protein
MFSKLLPVFMICALLLGVQQVAQAQKQAHKLSFGGGLGAGRLTGDLGSGGSFGLSLNFEGSYFIKPKFAVGLLVGANALLYGNDSSIVGISAYGDRLILAKADYFFMDKVFRPYVTLAAGVGIISTPEITTTTSTGGTSTIPSEKKANLCISPRVGFMINRFGIEFGYHFSGKTPKTEYLNVATSNKAFTFFNIVLKYVYTFEI